MIQTKNYSIVHNENLIQFSCSKNSDISTPLANTIVESDSIQECIDYLLNHNFLTFHIPLNLVLPECENKYWVPIYENRISKYENGEQVTENILVGYSEMTSEQKIEADRKIYLEKKTGEFRNMRYMLIVNYSYIMQNYTALAIMMMAKETVLNDVRMENGIRVAKLWFSDFETEADKSVVESDPVLCAGLQDVELYNPDK